MSSPDAYAEAIFDGFWNNDAVVPISRLGQGNAARLKAWMDTAHAWAARASAQTYLRRVEASPGVGGNKSGQ